MEKDSGAVKERTEAETRSMGLGGCDEEDDEEVHLTLPYQM